jgi:23S rRNA pseudouridine1911/1915/1917 synthase
MTEREDRHEIAAAADAAGERLDRFLAQRLPELSRSRLQALIRAGSVTRNGAVVLDLGRRIKAGDTYVVRVPPPEPAEPEPQAMPLTIVHEDAHLIVIDKPRGLTVHPGPGHASGTLVNALIAHCGASLSGIGGVKRPGIVHRLDKDTTGLLVAAKTDRAHQGLSEQFAAHGADGRLERGYRAIVWGVPDRPRGVIDAALARSASNRTKIAVVAEARGQRAVTRYEVLETFQASDGRKPVASLLRLVLETGRTHQVRVHLGHIGHPLLGDPTYGAGFKERPQSDAPGASGAGSAGPPGPARGRARVRASRDGQAARVRLAPAARHGRAGRCAQGSLTRGILCPRNRGLPSSDGAPRLGRPRLHPTSRRPPAATPHAGVACQPTRRPPASAAANSLPIFHPIPGDAGTDGRHSHLLICLLMCERPLPPAHGKVL